jgi:hypothetical protein
MLAVHLKRLRLPTILAEYQKLAQEAAGKGAKLVLFPEAFVSAYPKGLDFGARMGSRTPKGREDFLKQLPEFDATLAEYLKTLDDELQVIIEANEPLLNRGDGGFEKMLEIAAQQYTDADGQRNNLLSEEEVRLLSIPKGSLDEGERLQIESHVVHTFNFLQQIPWTRELQNLPAIARSHHEKLNGAGYPHRLTAPDIPVQTRMMTISDIFDALTAADRPYKRAVPLQRALDIMHEEVKGGMLDGELFRLFTEGKVFEKLGDGR